jgi:hypothetical protein
MPRTCNRKAGASDEFELYSSIGSIRLPPDAIDRAARRRKKVLATLLGVAVTIPAVASCLGDEIPLFRVVSLFPYWSLIGGLCTGLLHSDSLSLACLSLGFLQFPIYGYWLGRAWSRGKLARAVLAVISVHLITIGLFFATAVFGWIG